MFVEIFRNVDKIIIIINDKFCKSTETVELVVSIVSTKSPSCKLIWVDFNANVSLFETLKCQPVKIDDSEQIDQYLSGLSFNYTLLMEQASWRTIKLM